MHGKFGAAANHCLQASIKGRCLRENCNLFGLNFSKKAESNSAAIIPKARKHGGSQRKRMSRTSACFSEAIVSERELWNESWPSKNRTADGTRPFIRSRNDNTKKNGLDQAMHYWGVAERNENLLSFRIRAVQGQSFTSARPRRLADHEELQSRKTLRNCAPEPRDTPPKPDAGIGSEEDWGIDLKYGNSEESGVSEDGSTWYRESGEDLGKNGYRCCWTIMGGRSADGSSEWKEAWWEKSDWTGYKELVIYQVLKRGPRSNRNQGMVSLSGMRNGGRSTMLKVG